MNPSAVTNANVGFVGGWTQPQVPNTMNGAPPPSGAVGEFGLLPPGAPQRHTMGSLLEFTH